MVSRQTHGERWKAAWVKEWAAAAAAAGGGFKGEGESESLDKAGDG
jgi:hypothetical protein